MTDGRTIHHYDNRISDHKDDLFKQSDYRKKVLGLEFSTTDATEEMNKAVIESMTKQTFLARHPKWPCKMWSVCTVKHALVPAKLTAVEAPAKGLGNMSQIKVINARIFPNHANATQEFGPTGQNRIQFRIPSYANCWRDISRSFISYKLNLPGTDMTKISSRRMRDPPGC